MHKWSGLSGTPIRRFSETLRASLTTYGAPRATEALRKVACQRSIAWAIIALRSVRAAQDRYGSWPCENAGALQRIRMAF
jgi:hypothetical protein